MASKLWKKSAFTLMSIADAASWYCVLVLVILMLQSYMRETSQASYDPYEIIRGNQILERPCDEIYVVQEGETLHTISDKCGDPFIVEQNPHIHDPDDVFPGLVIKITPPSKPT
ncbi:hypothetical protein P3X46_003754 [Hevea brasiliensis]|uniref:LysM domain-containing protein n=1 Tax=Hevea brasiliensis TaxID=3981 RepID=A0ABQ9NC09_HEVBR|nr:uncharacterized protein LOC110637747 [Hevea brasiliensis]KAJ9188394.1 hypothetical protein P3X46_003754 [Hevea brasiliensis]